MNLATGAGAFLDGAFSIVNSTLSTNGAFSGSGTSQGGGITGQNGVSIHSATIFANSAATSEGTGKGGGIASLDSVAIESSIVTGNATDTLAPDCTGSVASQGFNIVGDPTDCGYAAGEGDLLGSPGAPVPVDLGPLVSNGGLTRTHALGPGAGVDAGNPAGCQNAGNATLTTDQRGQTRTFDGDGDGTARCDMGAYELVAEIPAEVIAATNIPPSTTVSPGASDVTALAFTINAPAGEGATVSRLRIEASGDGDDARDIAEVRWFLDADDDAVLDLEEPLLASGSFTADDGTLDLVAAEPVAIAEGGSASFLVTYTFTGGGTPSKGAASHGRGILFASLLLFPGVGLVVARRRSVVVLVLALSLGSLLMGSSACSDDDDDDGNTFDANLTEIDGTGSATQAKLSFANLPITGPAIAVVR